MVYGEFILNPSIKLCKLISNLLPKSLNSTYLTNSGTEAVEGAIKLARRYTNRKEIIGCENAYHGSTMGALSFMGIKDRRKPFEPLIPKVKFIKYNYEKDINNITSKTAAVILETIQGGAGFITPKNNYLKKIKERCKKVGALLILDEIQTGIGRTGKIFGFENYNCIPDIIVYGKGLGGGLPIGAFTANKRVMDSLQKNPIMGHITTFGGNPVISACAYATLKKISSSRIMQSCIKKEKLIRSLLIHPEIKEIRGKGLMLCVILSTPKKANTVILKAKENGLLLFWLLINKNAIRITPPLTITNKEIRKGCNIILDILNNKI
jgi:acetylornithine aminotransferase